MFAFRCQSAPEGERESFPSGNVNSSYAQAATSVLCVERSLGQGVVAQVLQAAEGKNPRRVASIHPLGKLLWFQTKANYFKGFVEGRKDKREHRNMSL